jgi:HEAT repeat protein
MEPGGPLARARALGRRVNGQPEHVTEALPELVSMISEHTDPFVLAAVAEALGLAWSEDAKPSLLSLVEHPDPSVRLAVARALPGGIESRDVADKVAQALIVLSRDPFDEVRDWATFGLGRQLNVDTPEIRATLLARVDDPHAKARDEGVCGLARRRDRRVLHIGSDYSRSQSLPSAYWRPRATCRTRTSSLCSFATTTTTLT